MLEYTADSVWKNILHELTAWGGYGASPRGMKTNEILGASNRISMLYPVIKNPHRNLGYKFMAAEAYWMLSGDDRVATIAPYSRDISQFSDDGYRFFGAYGPKIINQLPYVIRTLLNDKYSRQAVINIWRENPSESKDIPCTLSLQFLVRMGALHCIASMRSSDTWLGWPYDVFNFSMVSLMVLLHLNKPFGGLTLGGLTMNCGSQHLYERNIDAAEACLEWAPPLKNQNFRLEPSFFTGPNHLMSWLDNMRTTGNLKHIYSCE